MDINTTAEFRTIKKRNIQALIEASKVKKIESKGFLGFFKKVEYEDNFESYIAENTRLLGTLSGEGFLLFDDLVTFLQKYVSIDLNRAILILEREEKAFFLNTDYVQNIADQLSATTIKDKELEEFNEFNIGAPMPEMVGPQKEQIDQVLSLLKQLNEEVLYIRCELISE